MLVLGGNAESNHAAKSSSFVKGKRYSFSLFTQNESLDEQLASIEQYMMNKGWDNIVIEEQSLLNEAEEVNHEVVAEAILAAKNDGMAGIVHHVPLS